MNRGLFDTLKPLTSTNVEPYRHLTSGVLLNLATQTQAARQQSNNASSIAFPVAQNAPYATITNTSSTFNFKWNNARDCSIYHLMQNGHDTLDLKLILAVRNAPVSYKTSVQYYGTGISSGTAAGGSSLYSQSASMAWQIPGDVDDGSYTFTLNERRLRINLSTQPTDRIVRIVPRISNTNTFQETYGALTQNDKVYLYHVMVTDYLRGPETE